jgi:hypothetical protein
MIHRAAMLALPVFFALLVGCSSKQAQCDDFVGQIQTCYDGHCATTDSAFCDCWNDGMDMSAVDCSCVPLDLDAVCDIVDLPADLDCAVAAASVDNMCD